MKVIEFNEPVGGETAVMRPIIQDGETEDQAIERCLKAVPSGASDIRVVEKPDGPA